MTEKTETSMPTQVVTKPENNLFVFGCGTIGSCVVDCLLYGKDVFSKFDVSIDDYQIVIVDKLCRPEVNAFWTSLPEARRPRFVQMTFKQRTLREDMEKLNMAAGDIVIDVSSGVGTKDLMKECSKRGVRYINTANEGWNGFLNEMDVSIKELEKLKVKFGSGTPTSLVLHGMNPGLVNHFALECIDKLTSDERNHLDTVHVTEEDTQHLTNKREKLPCAVPHLVSTLPRMSDHVVSTWGPQNFVDEMTSVPRYVEKGKVVNGKRRAFNTVQTSVIYDPDARELRSYNGMNVIHEEIFTLYYYLKKLGLHKGVDIAFLYRPSETSMATLLKKQNRPMPRLGRRGLLLRGKSVKGYDTVGAYVKSTMPDGRIKGLWMGNTCRAGWSPLKALKCRFHNATTYQVAAGVLSALWYVLKHDKNGLMFAEDIAKADRVKLLAFASEWMGEIVTLSAVSI